MKQYLMLFLLSKLINLSIKNSRMNNNRIWRDKYNYLTETLKLKSHEKHMIEQQILLY